MHSAIVSVYEMLPFNPMLIFENLIFDEDDEERETIIITDLLELFGSDAEIIRVLQH